MYLSNNNVAAAVDDDDDDDYDIHANIKTTKEK